MEEQTQVKPKETTVLSCEDCGAIVNSKVGNYSRKHYDGHVFCYDCQNQSPKAFDVMEKAQKEKPKKSEKWQDDLVNFETLLADAHKKFKDKLNIHTELLDKDMEKKWAIVHATVTIRELTSVKGEEKVQVFQGTGDADQANCQSDMIKPHFLRMAETRAIARALRWATNNAAAAEEEKG